MKKYIRKKKKKQEETKNEKKSMWHIEAWMDQEAVKWFLVCVSVVEQNIEQLSFGWGMFRILEVRNVDYNAR